MSNVIWVLPLKLVLDDPNVLEEDVDTKQSYTKKTDDDWTITASLKADYYVWVTHWTATHPVYGTITGGKGRHDKDVQGPRNAVRAFLAAHPLKAFDLYDI